MKELEKYEKGYYLEEVECILSKTNEKIKCHTFIAYNNEYLRILPSEEYLTAIYTMLNEHFNHKYIVVSYIENNKIINERKWKLKKENMTIGSCCVLVNSLKTNVKYWKLPYEINNICNKLSKIGITDIDLLGKNMYMINEKLREKNEAIFHKDTICLFDKVINKIDSEKL